MLSLSDSCTCQYYSTDDMNKNYPETHRSKGNVGKLRGDIQCLGKSAIYALEEIRRQQLNVREHLPISVWESSEFEVHFDAAKILTQTS